MDITLWLFILVFFGGVIGFIGLFILSMFFDAIESYKTTAIIIPGFVCTLLTLFLISMIIMEFNIAIAGPHHYLEGLQLCGRG